MIMEKGNFEALKGLRVKVACGTATFAEKNIFNIVQKKIKAGKPYHFNAVLRVKDK